VDNGAPPDTNEARRRYRDLARHYDRSIRLINPLRRRVIERLNLSEGDHVLDMGSGTGASFDALHRAVGPSGRVTGVELSDEMAAVARQRIADHGWTNVDVVVGDATTAPLPNGVDGILFFLVHDITRIPAVVERAITAGRPGATVAALGPVTAPRWAVPVNLIVRAIARRYITTFEGFDRPWSHLAKAIPGLHVRRILGGGVYLATGQVERDA
jgi:ubiquinone/menaquinone biosynthesis C-methylase UbiE